MVVVLVLVVINWAGSISASISHWIARLTTRLRRIAEALRIEISEAEDAEDRHSRAMKSFWQLEKSGGLIQNMYLLDMYAEPPAFIASHSLPGNRASSMLPPTAEEAEDLAFDYINELDRGEMVFPDPYAYGISRRFKIVLCPVLDELGMLASVIGIEADMEYLKLVSDFRRLLAETILAALILSLLVAWLLARSFSRKIAHLNQSLEAVELEQCPEHQPMGVNELDLLGRGIEKLAHEIARQRLQVQRLYEQNSMSWLSPVELSRTKYVTRFRQSRNAFWPAQATS